MKRNWMKSVLRLNIFLTNPSDSLHRGSGVSKLPAQTATKLSKTGKI
jgi:hypothetical protein